MKQSLLTALLNREMDYGISQKSFSPIYSNYGLQFTPDFAGVRALYLHYNRYTRPLWDEFCVLPGQVEGCIQRPDRVTITTNAARAEVAFCGTDTFVIACETAQPVWLCAKPSEALVDCWLTAQSDDMLIFHGYSRNPDDRDPDQTVAVMAGVKCLKGSMTVTEQGVQVAPDEQGHVYLCVAASAMDVDAQEIAARLAAAPGELAEAVSATHAWLNECIRGIDLPVGDAREDQVFINAIMSLIFNLAKAPGNLQGYVSAFPNRGGYATHFLWDSAFQNLGYERMNPLLARDSLLQMCQCMRADGKIPMFMCSTWVRPHETQPALLGWAALRYINVTGDMDFARQVYPYLERNNKWWLTHRMTRFGVVYCPHGLETGQDNSPRFDHGAVLATDMNSYLLSQLRATAAIAELLGHAERAAYWLERAGRLSQAMVDVLYDPERNFFFDADVKTAQRQSVLAESGLIPLWAGVTLPADKAQRMIGEYLLNPAHFFGAVPFPCIAYSDPTYLPADWWRGPTWMPEAWLMLETLEKYDYPADYANSRKALYDMMCQDGLLHEHFNSQTGEGEGFVEQGWTAAIFIRMYLDLHSA